MDDVDELFLALSREPERAFNVVVGEEAGEDGRCKSAAEEPPGAFLSSAYFSAFPTTARFGGTAGTALVGRTPLEGLSFRGTGGGILADMFLWSDCSLES